MDKIIRQQQIISLKKRRVVRQEETHINSEIIGSNWIIQRLIIQNRLQLENKLCSTLSSMQRKTASFQVISKKLWVKLTIMSMHRKQVKFFLLRKFNSMIFHLNFLNHRTLTSFSCAVVIVMVQHRVASKNKVADVSLIALLH